jgi:hypothetical protein
VRDGLNAAKRGLPAVALVTEDLWPQGDFVASAFGMPDLPRVQLPHPVAGTGVENMRLVAEKIADEVLAALELRR